MKNNAFKIVTPRLIVRKYELTDAPLLKKAVDSSIEHLLPWMPWAKYEPETIAKKVERIQAWQADFLANKDYVYGIFSPDNQKLIGSTGLHTRQGKHILEIGYWISAEAAGKGYATEISYALTKTAFIYLGIDKMEIRCDIDNVKSARIPQKLGYRHEYTFRTIDKNEQGERVQHQVWTLFAEEFTPIEAYEPVAVYNGLGAKLPPLSVV